MSCPTCSHRKADALPCGSPALPGKKLCYFHHRDHKRRAYAASVIRRADVLGPRLPRMKSLADVQLALYEVLNALAAHRVSYPRAARILFDLERSAVPLRQPRPSPG